MVYTCMFILYVYIIHMYFIHVDNLTDNQCILYRFGLKLPWDSGKYQTRPILCMHNGAYNGWWVMSIRLKNWVLSILGTRYIYYKLKILLKTHTLYTLN